MKNFIPSYVRVPIIFAVVFAGMEYFIDSGVQPAFMVFPMVALFLGVFLFLLIAIEIVVSAIDNVTYHLLTDAQRKALEEAQSLPFTESNFYKSVMSKLTRTREIDEEGDLLLDHNYDGIKELDNVLPPWWVYMFYITIVFGFIYMVRFHVVTEYTQEQEFEMAMAQAEIDIEEYKKTAKDLIDVNNVTLLTDATELAAGKKIYEVNCIACHKADGGGSIGPNLTDEHWILGGGIKNVFNTLVKGGRDGKGMVSWQGILKPSEMQEVASYVISLKGTSPIDAKAAEGEIWIDEMTPKSENKDKESIEVIQNKPIENKLVTAE